jgi:hypothetical protein
LDLASIQTCTGTKERHSSKRKENTEGKERQKKEKIKEIKRGEIQSRKT